MIERGIFIPSFGHKSAEFRSDCVVEEGIGAEPAVKRGRGVRGAEPKGEDAGDVGCHCCGDRSGFEMVVLGAESRGGEFWRPSKDERRSGFGCEW